MDFGGRKSKAGVPTAINFFTPQARHLRYFPKG